MHQVTEIEKLVARLNSEAPENSITFREESARDIRYTLLFGSNNEELLYKLARIFGYQGEQFLGERVTHLEADDDWHGRGEVNLRELADEFFPVRGQFFDFDITIGELRLLALSSGS